MRPFKMLSRPRTGKSINWFMNSTDLQKRKSNSSKTENRREFRAWRGSLPTALERDTLLWPEVIAESVVAEASRYLRAASGREGPPSLPASPFFP